MQPTSAAATSSHGHALPISARHHCSDAASRISIPTLTAPDGLSGGKCLTLNSPGQDITTVHGVWSAFRCQDDRCSLPHSKAGLPGCSDADARASARPPADPAESEGSVSMSDTKTNIRLMVLKHEQHLTSLLQELAQPMSGSSCSPLTERISVLKSINRL